MRIVKQQAELKRITPNARELIEAAGRNCWRTEGSTGAAFIRKLLARTPPHESVLEHVDVTIKVVCDRGVSHELVRHRIGFSYSQESTRYCNYSADRFGGGIAVIEPPLEDGPEDEERMMRSLWVETTMAAELAYLQLLELGASPQIARSVLPTCLATTIYVTANLRSWRHFLELRLDKAAHPQMRELARLIRDLLTAELPEVFEDLADGFYQTRDGAERLANRVLHHIELDGHYGFQVVLTETIYAIASARRNV